MAGIDILFEKANAGHTVVVQNNVYVRKIPGMGAGVHISDIISISNVGNYANSYLKFFNIVSLSIPRKNLDTEQ